MNGYTMSLTVGLDNKLGGKKKHKLGGPFVDEHSDSISCCDTISTEVVHSSGNNPAVEFKIEENVLGGENI